MNSNPGVVPKNNRRVIYDYPPANLKCLCIEIFDNFLLSNMKNVKNRKENFLPFVDICLHSRDMNFQIFEKKCDKKIEHFVPP